MDHLCLWEFCKGNLEGGGLSWTTWSGLVYWRLSEMFEMGSGCGTSLSMGAL